MNELLKSDFFICMTICSVWRCSRQLWVSAGMLASSCWDQSLGGRELAIPAASSRGSVSMFLDEPVPKVYMCTYIDLACPCAYTGMGPTLTFSCRYIWTKAFFFCYLFFIHLPICSFFCKTNITKLEFLEVKIPKFMIIFHEIHIFALH